MSETATQFDPVKLSQERSNVAGAVFDEFMEGDAANLTPQENAQGYKDMLGYLESRPSTDGKAKFHDAKTGAYISREDANAVYSPEQSADADEYDSLSVSELLKLSIKAENSKDKTTMLSVDDAIMDRITGLGLSEELSNSDGTKREQSEQDNMFNRVMKLRAELALQETEGTKSVFPEVKDIKDEETVSGILNEDGTYGINGPGGAAHGGGYDGPVTPGMELVPFEGSDDEPVTPVGERIKQNIKRRWLALKLGNFGEAMLPETRKGKIALAVGAVALAYGAYKVQQNGGDAQPFINGNGGGEIAAEALDSADASGNANSFMDNSNAFMGEAVDAGSAAEATDVDTVHNTLAGGGDQSGAEVAAQNIGSDVDVSNYSWTVAHELSLGGETELMNEGLEQYNQANGTAFALTPHEGSTWIMDGSRAIQQAEMENLNRIMVEISKDLAKA